MLLYVLRAAKRINSGRAKTYQLLNLVPRYARLVYLENISPWRVCAPSLMNFSFVPSHPQRISSNWSPLINLFVIPPTEKPLRKRLLISFLIFPIIVLTLPDPVGLPSPLILASQIEISNAMVDGSRPPQRINTLRIPYPQDWTLPNL